MAQGDGSITEVKQPKGKSYSPKHWRVAVSFGTDPLTSKRLKAQRNVRGTKSDACKVRNQLLEDFRNGLNPNAANTTFGDFANQWHKNRVAAEAVTKTRLKREETMVRDLCEHLGSVRLRDIAPQTIETVYARIREQKVEARGKCSGTTMNMYHKLLKQILGKAMDYDIILRNPAAKVEAPKVDPVDRRSLTTEQAQDLLAKVNEAEEEAYSNRIQIEERQQRRGDTSERSYLRGMSQISRVMAVRIAMATGLRRGEVVGLTWKYVDLKRGTIRVAHSVTVYSEVKDPKSEAGKRVLKIDEETVSHLARWKEFQQEELAVLCLEQTDDTPVCCNDKGEIMKPTNFSRWWRDWSKKQGFEGWRFHEIRHSHATHLIASGMDFKTAQHRLGHSSAKLTMDQYAHAMPENDERAAEIIGNLYSSGPKASEELQKTA